MKLIALIVVYFATLVIYSIYSQICLKEICLYSINEYLNLIINILRLKNKIDSIFCFLVYKA